MSLWVPIGAKVALDAATAETERRLRHEVHVMSRALNQIQRGLAAGEKDWTQKLAKAALVEADQEIWT